jgi:hypothetical protein
MELRKVSLELRKVSLELRKVSLELRNVSLELRNVDSFTRLAVQHEPHRRLAGGADPAPEFGAPVRFVIGDKTALEGYTPECGATIGVGLHVVPRRAGKSAPL